MFYEVKSEQQHPVELHKHYWQTNHTKSQMPKTKSVALSLTAEPLAFQITYYSIWQKHLNSNAGHHFTFTKDHIIRQPKKISFIWNPNHEIVKQPCLM